MKQTNITAETFYPVYGLRNTHAQSLINSSGYRRQIVSRRAKSLLAAEQDWVVDGGNDVRLLGHYSKQAGDSKGLVILFHGWEGSSRSNYVVGVGGELFAQGFDVFRLNFRDHGDTHHLNPGIFHSCLLDEVIHALQDIQQRTGAKNWALSGYSLGGNFALRVALQAPAAGLLLAQVIAICPVVSPANVLKAMEDGPWVYENYFIRKWARSLRHKQSLFPDAYEYEEWHALGGLRARTGFFATRYYEFESLEHYFEGYSIAGERLAAIRIPTTILTSEDDPVVPVADFRDLPENESIELLVARFGGHCAFLKNWKMESWADDLIVERVLQSARRSESARRSA
ncbi:MAG: alpha/beta fold hydrolase [Gammaproteobacteria bacterium]|nr:MAG: alpha/beta fold hydrolase [Gammaproteobacteria bacterium]